MDSVAFLILVFNEELSLRYRNQVDDLNAKIFAAKNENTQDDSTQCDFAGQPILYSIGVDQFIILIF